MLKNQLFSIVIFYKWVKKVSVMFCLTLLFEVSYLHSNDLIL